MIVMGWVIVAVNLVLVVADMEVEVEEAGAKFTVAVPVVGGMETETTDPDDGDQPAYLTTSRGEAREMSRDVVFPT